MFRRLTTPQLVFDVVVACVAVLLRLTVPLETSAGWVMLLAMGAAFALRRLSPALALAIAWLGALAQMLSMMPPDAANLAILAVLYSTARYGGPIAKWAGLASAGLGALVATAYLILNNYTAIDVSGGNSLWIAPQALAIFFGFAASLAVLGISWTIGLLVRTRVNAREAKLQQVVAEQSVVVEQERNRVARDMHDVVAHSLAVVIAQADGARYASATDPDAADQALTTIAATAREALADVRLLLGQLRHNQELGPQPALADLQPLIAQLRASGLDIDFTETGEAPSLPASQQLAIYRIVQEALTNALRHGDPAGRVEVRLEWTTTAAALSITNPLPANPTEQGTVGHGITGMRERAALVGGLVTAKPVGGSFAVAATIPIAVHA